MQSDAADVSTYLTEVPPARRDALERLRAICIESLTGFDEVMAYGMPGYARDGVVEVGFNSQRQYISVYVLRRDVMERHRGELPKGSGKGCLRFLTPDSIDWGLLATLLAETVASTGEVC